jgi:hypothetical protein
MSDVQMFEKQGVFRKAWKHPIYRDIIVPRRVAVAIAIMEMGVSDYEEIATAVGLTEEAVEEIDSVEDTEIRRLACVGIPYGVYFNIDKPLRCPKCQCMINLVPCVSCDGPIKHKEAIKDTRSKV